MGGIEKGDREWRAGISGFHGSQGMYIYAKTKKEAYGIAIKSYFNRYIYSKNYHKRMTAADRKRITTDKIRMEWIRAWKNADGSIPAWRKKMYEKRKRR